MDLANWAATRRRTLRQLGPLDIRGVTPSLRDFLNAVRTHRRTLSVVAELSRQVPEEGLTFADADLARLVDACDQAEVAALAVGVEPAALGGRPEDLAFAQNTTTPVLARDLVISREQLYLARLHGADAVWLHAAVLGPGELRTFLEIASSMHMAAAVEVDSPQALQQAQAATARLVVVAAPDARPPALLEQVPRSTGVLVRGPFEKPEDLRALKGRADGVWVCGPLMRSDQPEAFLRALVAEGDELP